MYGRSIGIRGIGFQPMVALADGGMDFQSVCRGTPRTWHRLSADGRGISATSIGTPIEKQERSDLPHRRGSPLLPTRLRRCS
jgi:hypothetical protein